MKVIIFDSDYMNMGLCFDYRFLDNQSIIKSAHSHNFYEYFIITKGHVIHHVNGSREWLSKGDLVFIRPSDYHSYEVYQQETFEMINVSFSAHHFFAACKYLGKDIERQIQTPLFPPKANILPFADCMLIEDHSFLNYFGGTSYELYIRFRLLLMETMVTFVRYFQLKSQQSSSPWLNCALEQMTLKENIEEGIPALLRITGLSHGYLCRIMKQQMGITPNQYITKARMVFAAKMLLNSDRDILTISLKTGYSSLSHFVSTFKKFYGYSPKKYRQVHSDS